MRPLSGPQRHELLRAIFGYACGYCGVRDDESGSELDEDHYQPRCKGGADALENLVYSCPTCNRLKGDFRDPDPDSQRRILHPQRDDLSVHLQGGPDGSLVPLTAVAAFHIRPLRLSRPQLVMLRLRRQRRSALEMENVRLGNEMRVLEEQRRDVVALVRRAMDGDEEAVRRLRRALRRR